WWGIPKTCPNAKLAYEFARFVTNHDNHAKECSKFGMIPVRKDLLLNLPSVFDEGWVGEIFKTSVDQINLNMTNNQLATVPLVKGYPQVAQILVDAWDKLCVGYDEKKEGKIDAAAMKQKLANDFGAKEKAVLGAEYPK
ncbi:MAG TPA: hypothetical protein VKF42_11435, partial [Chitinivibrionales bacterium]|nr:hypothetical protein [Chitinivibrionales bacterium]